MEILSKEYNKAFSKVMATAYDYFEDLGLKPIVTQHTLLGIHRDGGFLNRPNDCIDIMCRGEDIAKVGANFQKEKWFAHAQQGELEYAIHYFNFDLGEDCPHRIELLPFYEKDDKMITNFTGSTVRAWDKKLFDETKTLEFMGKKYRVPKDIEGWLEAYYGKKWKTPDPQFHWRTHSVNKYEL